MEQDGTQQGKTVLIVEDEEMLANAMVEALTDAGYSVTSAGNGEDGLKKAMETHPMLILLDVMMPKMDGLSMMTALKQQQSDPKSHVIFFTNLSQAEKIADAVKEGAEGYMVKADSSLEDIVAKVNQFFTTH